MDDHLRNFLYVISNPKLICENGAEMEFNYRFDYQHMHAKLTVYTPSGNITYHIRPLTHGNA